MKSPTYGVVCLCGCGRPTYGFVWADHFSPRPSEEPVTRKLSHVPYWLYCLVILSVGTVCFLIGRAS